jgi:ribulose 1,5-bisphosphate synthetase/thiazole synthase
MLLREWSVVEPSGLSPRASGIRNDGGISVALRMGTRGRRLTLSTALIGVAVGVASAAFPTSGGRAEAADSPSFRWPRASLSLDLAPSRPTSVSSGHHVLPVIDRADVLVVHGALSGCAVATELARRGRRVVLCTPDSSLPWEFAVCLRAWADKRELAELSDELRELLNSCVKSETSDGELILHVGKVSEGAEDWLLDSGVRIYYGALPCGVLRGGHCVTGVVVAGKFGLGVIEADAVVDCSPCADLARMAGAETITRVAAGSPLQLSYCLRLEGDDVALDDISVEHCAELADRRIRMHGPYAEFRIRAPVNLQGPLRDARTTLASRHVAMRSVLGLPRGAHLSPRLLRTPDDVLLGPVARIRSAAAASRAGARDGAARPLEAALCRPASVANVWVCSTALDVNDAQAASLASPLRAVQIASSILKADIAAEARAALAVRRGAATLRVVAPGPPADATESVAMRMEAVRPIFVEPRTVALRNTPIPVIAQCDVLVVGGGTSGLPAGWAAARAGATTIVVEKHADVGGTHTIGGVANYWYGRPTRFSKGLDDEYAAVAGPGLPKSLAMLDVLVREGAVVLPKCFVVGALARGNAVEGVAIATPNGLAGIRAKTVVDATGDADVAARAGANCYYGNGRDAMTMWCSFGKFNTTKETVSRQYDSVVDLCDPADVSRARITGRRRKGIFGHGEFPQHYLTVRESRHIAGRKTITYGGILSGETFGDLVVVARSNFDIKGIASSDLSRCGYVSWEFRRNFSAAIPYGALLPSDLQNILVVGKAYSATHDALALARMQQDLIAMGGVAGLASAAACRSNRPVAEIDVEALQRELVTHGILTDEDLAAFRPRRQRPSRDKIAALAAGLAEGRLDLPEQVALLMQGDRAIPALRAAMERTDDEAGCIELARALCFLGDRAGAPVLIDAIDRETSGKLPSVKMVHGPPDHGWAPAPAYWIYAVGLTGDQRIEPVLERLARKVEPPPDETGRTDSSFEYVLAIASAAERIGSPSLVPTLELLAQKPAIAGSILRREGDPRPSRYVAAERHAYLELCVARAMARCGSLKGYSVLIDYLEDMRAVLARSAHMELAELSGEDLGFAADAWRAWLERLDGAPAPQPYRKRL